MFRIILWSSSWNYWHAAVLKLNASYWILFLSARSARDVEALSLYSALVCLSYLNANMPVNTEAIMLEINRLRSLMLRLPPCIFFGDARSQKLI